MRTNAAKLSAIIGTTLLVIGTAGTASTALAQDTSTIEYQEYQVEEKRDGLLFGVGLDAGHLACEGFGCEGFTSAAGLNAHVGLMLSPRFAIVGNIGAMGHMGDRLFVSQGIATVGPRIWLGDRFWLEGSVGAARVAFDYDVSVANVSDSSGYVLAAAAGAGFELMSTPEFALDVHFRGGSGFYSDTPELQVRNLGIGVGATWY